MLSFQRPFVNFYAPVFILYELSSPFLNIHWFLDKVNMTGSRAQWYNGMLLLFVFFSCRLVWGTWQSAMVYWDMWHALQQTWSATSSSSPLSGPVDINAQVFHPVRDGAMYLDKTCARANAEIARFAKYTAGGVPTWLVVTYVTSNLILNSLNYYWFTKMIETVLKRFRGPAPEKDRARPEKVTKLNEELAQEIVLEAASKLEDEHSAHVDCDLQDQHSSAVDARLGEELRKRKTELAAKMQMS